MRGILLAAGAGGGAVVLSLSPLGCSCQGSREADIIHLIGSHC